MARPPTLRLGDVDASLDMTDAKFKEYLKVYYQGQHFPFPDKILNESSYDNDKRWIGYRNLAKDHVEELTRKLQATGFMPNANHDGLFGYVTQAAVRLFQEYVRTRDQTISKAERKQVVPDGIVGPITQAHLKRWVKAGLQPDWLRKEEPSALALTWFNRFRSAAFQLREKPTPMIKIPESYGKKCDSLPLDKWTFSLEEPQLFGIRRKANIS
ncbi:MAG: peptidoglycan-binding protein, partial [Bacteroidota bacterium]